MFSSDGGIGMFVGIEKFRLCVWSWLWYGFCLRIIIFICLNGVVLNVVKICGLGGNIVVLLVLCWCRKLDSLCICGCSR